MDQWLHSSLFTIQGWHLTPAKLFYCGLVTILGMILHRMVKARWKQRIYKPYEVGEEGRRRFEKYLRWIWLLILLIGYIKALGLDFVFYPSDGTTDTEGIVLRISHFVFALLIYALARISDWVVNQILVKKYYENLDESSGEFQSRQISVSKSVVSKTVRYIIGILASILLINNFDLDFQIFQYQIEDKVLSFRISKILVAILIILIGRLIVWLVTQVLLHGIYRQRKMDAGSQFAVNQILKYVIYVITILFAINALGINMTIIWGGAAALLVGIGLGLQQTFNDFFSGLVLLFERSVAVGDVLEINGDVGNVVRIGLRSSIIEMRDNQSVIVPNSQLVNEVVHNWTHFTDKVRFQVDVGVAYGSDTALVKRLLLEAVNNHSLVLSYPKPFVRFNDFGSSSLDFSIYFFSNTYPNIDDTKSDIRFDIDRLFREHNIEIPFPQTDVWVRSNPSA